MRTAGSASRLLWLRQLEKVRILEQSLRAELTYALPRPNVREATLKGLVNTVDLLTLVMQPYLPCEADVRPLADLETPMKAVQRCSDALTALREWRHHARATREAFQTGAEPHMGWLWVKSLVRQLAQRMPGRTPPI